MVLGICSINAGSTIYLYQEVQKTPTVSGWGFFIVRVLTLLIPVPRF
jgi:hypothetical protein